jgi:hypothetical protein
MKWIYYENKIKAPDYPEWWLYEDDRCLITLRFENGYWYDYGNYPFDFFEGKKWRKIERAKSDIEKAIRKFAKKILMN